MKKSELQEDWLASNALVAFAGAALMARYSQLQGGAYQLTADATASAFLIISSYVLAAFLFGLSVFLAAASAVPNLRLWAFRLVTPILPLLGLAALIAFTLNWISEFAEISHEHWWRPVVFWGGLGMFLFIGFTITRKPLYETFRQIIRPKPKQDAKSDVPSVGEPPTTSELMSPPRQVHPPESRGPGIAAPAVIAVIGFTLGVVLCSRLRNNDN